MTQTTPVLAALVDAPELDLIAATHTLIAEQGDEAGFELARFISLSERLPSGLIHAESIWVTASPPVGLSPLAPGSAWFAIDRSLVAAISPGRSSLVSLAADLARYAIAARAVAVRLAPAPALIEALLSNAPLSPPQAAELALRLGAGSEHVAALDRLTNVRADLGAMARRSFEPQVHLHPSTRPAKWRRLGASIGRRIVDAIPEGSLRVLITDAPEAIEHLSPYVRDLGVQIAAWALENRSTLMTEGLADAIASGDGRATLPDLAALAVTDLLRGRGEILAERRKIERATGLELFDEAGMIFGYAELSNLAAPDPRAVPAGSKGLLAVIAGPASEALLESANVLLETGRVEAIATLFGGAIGPSLATPELLVASDDAFEHDAAARVQRRGDALGMKVPRLQRIDVDDDEGAPRALLDLLRLTRRAQLCGTLPLEARRIVVLYGRPSTARPAALDRRLGVVSASRLTLSVLCSNEGSPAARSGDASKPPSSLRYRA